jgi:hypothetical protein
MAPAQSLSIHCHVSNLSRRKPNGGERSAVANAAYISGSALWNAREQRLADFSNRRHVVFSTIIAPADAADWVFDRERLWNTVEQTLKRRDARLAKAITVAITRGIPRQNWPELARAYAQQFVELGMVADVAVHDDGTGHNPHIHLLLTVNQLGHGPQGPNGLGGKLASVDQKSFVVAARTGWATLNNQFLAAAGSTIRVDARSFKARGITRTPTRHRGPHQPERSIPPQPEVTSMSRDERQRPWFRTAAERAQEREPTPEQATDHLGEERDLLARALAMPDRPEEARLRQAVAREPEPVRAQVDAEILSARIDALRADARYERLDRLAQQLPDHARQDLQTIRSRAQMPFDWPGPEPEPATPRQQRPRDRDDHDR